MTTYTGNLNTQQAIFSCAQNRSRYIFERAFGHLKTHWHCLGTKQPMQEENVNFVICACVILHNICAQCQHPTDLEQGEPHYAPLPPTDSRIVVQMRGSRRGGGYDGASSNHKMAKQIGSPVLVKRISKSIPTVSIGSQIKFVFEYICLTPVFISNSRCLWKCGGPLTMPAAFLKLYACHFLKSSWRET